jgi:glycosyltransferase involved in cell wall biosynthesis
VTHLYPKDSRRLLESATNSAAKNASIIFTPSEFTKKELADAYNISENRITTTPLSVNHDIYKQQSEEQILKTLKSFKVSRRNYFLSIGRLESKKNLITLIRGFNIFKRMQGHGDPHELILIGDPGFGFSEIKAYAKGSPFKSQIKHMGWVDEAYIPGLIAGATAYTFPSWYEGFGIPNLEALACGTPLITSDIPVHREVVGEAAIFVPPEKPESWAEAMKVISYDNELREDLIKKGLEHVKSFSWKSTAQKTLDSLFALM